MATPHQTASGTVAESPLVLIDVVTTEGAVGHAIVFTYNYAALKPTADLIANLAPLVEGEDLAPAALESKLVRRFRLLGHTRAARYGALRNRHGALGRTRSCT